MEEFIQHFSKYNKLLFGILLYLLYYYSDLKIFGVISSIVIFEYLLERSIVSVCSNLKIESVVYTSVDQLKDQIKSVIDDNIKNDKLKIVKVIKSKYNQK